MEARDRSSFHENGCHFELDIKKNGSFVFLVAADYTETVYEVGDDYYHNVIDTSYFFQFSGKWLWEDDHSKLTLKYDDGASETYQALEVRKRFLKLQRVVGDKTYVLYCQFMKPGGDGSWFGGEL